MSYFVGSGVGRKENKDKDREKGERKSGEKTR